MLSLNLGSEPIAVIGAVSAGLVTVQSAALPLSSGVHAIVGATIVVLGVILARAQVVPAVKVPVPPQA